MRRARRGAAPRVALLALLPPTVAPADAGHRAGARGGNAQRGLGDLAARPVRCLGADPQELLRNLTSARAYNRLDHPGAAGGAPARVEQQIYVKKLVGVDQTGQTLTLSGFWRSAWLDERLAFAKEWGDCFDHLDLQLKRNLDGPPVQDPLLIWSPSLFFDNVLTESYGTYSFQVMPSGQVTRSIKMLHKFSCAMDFGRMPFDSQRCPIRIMSYAEPDSSVNLGPIGNTFVDRHGDADGPVQNTLWTVADSFAAIAKEGYNFGSDAREYDVLTISFILQRRSAFYLRRDVAYAVLFVCMSYVGFFIDAESAPARAALATIPVLTMLSHLNSVEQTLPPLSERTWLHAILMLSLVYTGLAVVELAVVSATLSLERRRARRRATFEKLAKRMHDDDNPLNEREHKMFLTFFKTFDSAGIPDGTVSIKELRAGLRYFNVYYSLEQCEEVIALVRKKHVPAPSPRHKSLSGGERQDFDAPADAEAGRGPDSIAIALGGSPQSHNATPAVARGASVSAAAAAAQVVQDALWGSGSCGAASVRPGFPRALACLGAPEPRPGITRAASLPRGRQGLQPEVRKQQPPTERRLSYVHQSTVEIEKTLSELPSTPDSISYLEFRTLLIMFETGDINPTPPCVTKFFDERPTDIVDGLARYLYLTTYFFCIFMMAPTISTYPSNADQ